MASAGKTVKENIQGIGNQTASTAAEGIQSGASYVADRAQEAVDTVSDYTSRGMRDAGEYIDRKSSEATSAVASGFRSASGALRDHLPQEGPIGQASAAVAKRLEDAGEYLETEGLRGIEDDISELIRRNPITSLLIGVGLGYLVARSLSQR